MGIHKHLYDDYIHVLTPVLESKADEFIVLGYGEVAIGDIWKFLTVKTWRNPKEGVRIYELVSDIFSMKIGDYMNYATVEAFKSPNIFNDLDSEELQELLDTKSK